MQPSTREVLAVQAGSVLQIAEAIAINKLPDAVTKAFKAKYPKARASRAEK